MQNFELPANDGMFTVRVGAVEAPLHLTRSARSETLAIGFHGAVDRESRCLPAFLPPIAEVGQYAHQLMVSDVSLRRSADLNIAWFAGDNEFDSQAEYPAIFRRVAHLLGVRRIIFFGTSAGGFAALYFSSCLEGSLAIVGNPQTNIRGFWPRHVEAYFSSCWNDGAKSQENYPSCIDVGERYSGAVRNSVIYLQNPTDDFHLYRHMVPFLSKVREPGAWKRIALESQFGGKLGHTPDWAAFAPWFKAAVLTPAWLANDIIQTKHAIASATRVDTSGVKMKNAADRFLLDVRKADLLRQIQLGR